jgi:hypothetical protein
VRASRYAAACRFITDLTAMPARGRRPQRAAWATEPPRASRRTGQPGRKQALDQLEVVGRLDGHQTGVDIVSFGPQQVVDVEVDLWHAKQAGGLAGFLFVLRQRAQRNHLNRRQAQRGIQAGVGVPARADKGNSKFVHVCSSGGGVQRSGLIGIPRSARDADQAKVVLPIISGRR